MLRLSRAFSTSCCLRCSLVIELALSNLDSSLLTVLEPPLDSFLGAGGLGRPVVLETKNSSGNSPTPVSFQLTGIAQALVKTSSCFGCLPIKARSNLTVS